MTFRFYKVVYVGYVIVDACSYITKENYNFLVVTQSSG